jgi:hypothetical protein
MLASVFTKSARDALLWTVAAMAVSLHAAHTGHGTEGVRADRRLELEVQAPDGLVLEGIHAFDDDEAALAQDAHPVGHALDL